MKHTGITLEKMRLDLNEQLYRADQVILMTVTKDEPTVSICIDDLTPEGFKNLSNAFCELGAFLARRGFDCLEDMLDDLEEDLDG